MAIKINNTTVIDDSRNLTNLGSAIAVSQGGTGATDAASARSNLNIANKSGDTLTGPLTVQGSFNYPNGNISGQRFYLQQNQGGKYFILGSVGVETFDSYIHVKTNKPNVQTDMTMFRITGYYPYSSYGEAYMGCYTAPWQPTEPYGVIVSNLGDVAVGNSMYYSSDNYLCLCLYWPTAYTGLLVEHIGAGQDYGSYTNSDLQILAFRKTTSTSKAY